MAWGDPFVPLNLKFLFCKINKGEKKSLSYLHDFIVGIDEKNFYDCGVGAGGSCVNVSWDTAPPEQVHA